ncbi:MAG: hypothetical protein PVH92_02955 [Anaerolineales bacterium]|jgi:hypothetical protein
MRHFLLTTNENHGALWDTRCVRAALQTDEGSLVKPASQIGNGETRVDGIRHDLDLFIPI